MKQEEFCWSDVSNGERKKNVATAESKNFFPLLSSNIQCECAGN